MFQRWSPFFFSILTQFFCVGLGSYYLIGMRAIKMPANIDLSHCAVGGVQRFEYTPEVCAQIAAGQYMNAPEFIAQLFVILFVVALFIGYLMSVWGSRVGNQMQVVSGVLAAVMVVVYLERAYVAAFALLVGHLIGWAIQWSQQRRLVHKNAEEL